jgi:hypothetical protein
VQTLSVTVPACGTYWKSGLLTPAELSRVVRQARAKPLLDDLEFNGKPTAVADGARCRDLTPY